jgi:hypothetical protein
MNSEDLKLLLQIAKSKIDKEYMNFVAIESFIMSNHGNEVFNQIKDEIIKYIEMKKIQKEKTRSYWMLISNPLKWGEIPEYMFNETLFNLNENEIISWSINKNTDISLQMREGEFGIIKVSEDKRTITQRTDKNNNLVPLVEAGIYAIFEIVKDTDGDVTFEDENGDYCVNVRVIDNFFNKCKQISKEKSIEVLGENIFKSLPSRKIEKRQFELIQNLIKN